MYSLRGSFWSQTDQNSSPGSAWGKITSLPWPGFPYLSNNNNNSITTRLLATIIILYTNCRQLVQTTRGAELRVLWSHFDLVKESAVRLDVGEDRESESLPVGKLPSPVCLANPSYLE